MNTRHLLLSSIAALAAACGRSNEGASAPAVDNSAPVTVQAATIGSTAGPAGTEIPGAIESARLAVVRSRLAGTVTGMGYREGERVAEGAVLARIDGEAAGAALTAAQTAEAAATRDLSRATALLAKNAATKNEVENATTALARANAAVVAAREAVSWAAVRAPFAGRIARKVANVGDTVNPGSPIVEVEGDGALEAVASVEAAAQPQMRVGRKLEVRVDGLAAPLTGTVRTVSPSADPATHRFTVRVSLPAQSGIRGGLFARLVIPGVTDSPTLRAPTSAVFRRGGLTGVYVIRDGRAWLRWIAPGDAAGDTIEIRAGLEGGEKVALDPANLYDGARVTEGR